MSLLTKGGGGAGGKVFLDGERVKQLEMTSYKGSNPLAIGEEGLDIPANTLIEEALQIINNVKKKGQYVWKQLTAEGGDFIAYVTADDEASYPDGGEQDGYWYELMEELVYLYSEETITDGSASTDPEGSLHFVI